MPGTAPTRSGSSTPSRRARRAGTIHRLDASERELPAELFRASTHHVGLAEAVELARALGRLPARTVIYGIEGESFEIGERAHAAQSRPPPSASPRPCERRWPSAREGRDGRPDAHDRVAGARRGRHARHADPRPTRGALAFLARALPRALRGRVARHARRGRRGRSPSFGSTRPSRKRRASSSSRSTSSSERSEGCGLSRSRLRVPPDARLTAPREARPRPRGCADPHHFRKGELWQLSRR